MLWAGCQPQLSGREFGKPGRSGAGFTQTGATGIPWTHQASRLGGQRHEELAGPQIPHPAGLGSPVWGPPPSAQEP